MKKALILLCGILLFPEIIPARSTIEISTQEPQALSRKERRKPQKEEETSNNPPLPEKIEQYFNFQAANASEKLFLHTDKPYYGAGEIIWYKGYIVNGSSHLSDESLSNYIYVELLDRENKVIERQKIRRDTISETFHNGIKLPEELTPGDYTLRGYTRWMQNFDPDYFFQKRLRIGNSIATQIPPP